MQPFAIISTGGKQYQVKEGQELTVELLAAQEGDTVELDTLVAHNGSDLAVGTPQLEQKVKATVLGEKRAKKILVFKKHRRSTYKKMNGHRQSLQTIRIDSIPNN